MSTKYTNVGQSGCAIVGTTVADTEKKYSNTGSAVYGKTGNNVTPADLGFSGDVTELWMRFDYYVHSTDNNIKITFYFDNAQGTSYIGLYGSRVRYNENGNSFGSVNTALYNKPINKVVFHISKTALQIYINGVVAFSDTGINNGSKITGMRFLSEKDIDSTTANNNMFSNVIIADYDCSNETLESNSTTISTNETINADVLREVSTDVILNADISRTLKDNTNAIILNADISRKTNIDEIANYDISRILKDNTIAVTNYYENEGYSEKMLVASQEITCDATKSNTGRAINNANKYKCFPIQDVKELWVKFDAYIVSGGSLRVYSDDSHGVNGVRLWHKAATAKTAIWLNDTNKDQDGIVIDGLQRYVLHMKSDATNGLIEIYIDNDSKPVGSYAGNVNSGDAFSNFYMQSDDGNNALYSNIIISNSKIGINENAKNENQWVQPVLTANGDFINDDFAVRKSNNSSYAYYLFFNPNGGISFNAGQYYDIHIKNKIYIDCFNIAIAYDDNGVNYNTVQFTGKLLYSDDGNSYTELTSFNKNDVSNYLIIDAKHSQHHYYRFSIDTITNSSNNFVGLLRINIDAVTNSTIISTNETINADISREVSTELVNVYDVCRVITDNTKAIILNADISREVSTELVNVYDVCRVIADNTNAIILNADISRKTNIYEIANYDTQRITSNSYTMTEDIARNIVYNAKLEADTKRTKHIVTVNNADTRISIPSVITDQSSGLQSVNINMSQSQLSDNVKIVTINPVDINGAVIGNFLDYKLNMRAETTSQKGILQEITCMTDKDETLYKKIVYTDYDDDSTVKIYHGKRIYDETLVNNKSEIVSYMKLSKHMNKIANVLGCNLVMCSDDYISTCSLNGSGATYQSIISELCGWTSKLPNMFINAFLRGNTLYIIQRGHEPNEINIDNIKMTEPTIAKKLIRTEWNNPQSTNSDNSQDNNNDNDKDKDDGDDTNSGVDKQEPRVETSSDTRYSADGGYSVTETQRTYERIGALHGAVMISYETEKCTAYSAENPASTSVEGGVTVYRGASRDITVTLTETYHDYDSCGWHTVTTTTTVDGVLKETHTSESLGSTEGVTPFRVHAANDAKKKSDAIGTDAIGTDDSNSLIDSDFPVYGDYLTTCKDDIKWLNRKVQETVTLSIYDYTHIFDFQDKIVYKGNTYSIQSSSFEKNSTIVNKQDLVLIRFY